MVEPFGEIPAGKTDLLRALHLYFGPECAAKFRSCFGQVDEDSDVFFHLRSRVLRRQSTLRPHLEHIKRLVANCMGTGPSFESSCRAMLQIVFGEAWSTHPLECKGICFYGCPPDRSSFI